jgi:amino acid adenylation domain-containing protein
VDRTFVQIFEEQAARTPDALAVVFNRAELTYAELNQRSNQLAHFLRRRGIGAEVRVGLCLDRSAEMLISVLAILKAGGAYVPLDPSYPAERLAYLARDASLDMLLVGTLSGELPLCRGTLIELGASQDEIQTESRHNPISGIVTDNIAYIIYTSGSTGLPKGIAVAHRSLANLVQAQNKVFRVGHPDRILQFASLSFDASIFEIAMALSTGATLVMAEPEKLLPGPDMIALLERYGITQVTIPPSVLRHLPDATLPELRQIIVAGEAFDTNLVKRWCAGRQFFNAYGPTETTVWASVSVCRAEDVQISIGAPITNAQLYVLDETGNPRSANAVGEIYIGGAGVARGYWNRADLTAERFIPDPFSGKEGARLYRTGDLGYRCADGAITFVGRKYGQAKIRGHRIELGEIETALRQHPKVQAAAVLALGPETGDKRLVTYLVTREGEKVKSSELRSHLNARLPKYMTPSQFVMLKEFPLTNNGKIDRKALAATWTEPELPYKEPKTFMERNLADACCGVLRLSRISLNSTFTELGGSSLDATRVAAALREAASIETPLHDLLGPGTLEEIAGDLEQSLGTVSLVRIKPKKRTQDLPPASFSQERVWFLNQMDPSNLSYNANAKIIFSGELDISALIRALNGIVERHEIYRTTFREIEGRLFQKIHSPWQVDPGVADLEGLELGKQLERAEALFQLQSRQTFDLTQLPLARWRLIRFGSSKHELFITEHHVIHDGWSFNIFLKEFTELYASFVSGSVPQITAAPLQFADFAQWQREFAESHAAQIQLEYWRKTLENMPPLLSLPYDHPRPAVQTHRGSVESVEIGQALQSSLSLAARNSHVTQFVLFAAAFQILLFRYSGQGDFCFGTAIANRRLAETSDLIGMLVDNVALRARIDGAATLAEVIEHMRKTTLEAYAHQDVPFDKVVQAVDPQRDLSYNPIFQVMLSFHDSPVKCAQLGELIVKVEPAVSNGSAKFDLNVVLIPVQADDPESRAKLLWEYNTDLFERETILRMAKHYLKLLHDVALNPEQRLAELELLDETEYAHIVYDWNRTEAPCPQQCLHLLFEQQAAQTPNAIAVTCEGKQLNYEELNRRANQIARYLQKQGTGPETLVGICLERSLDLVAGLLAIVKTGAAYVPLDPALPLHRLSYMLEDTHSPLVLTRRALLASLPNDEMIRMVCLDEDRKRISEEPTNNLESASNPENLVYVIYTSGSTGKPKGVMIQHQSLINVLNFFREKLNVAQHDSLLATTTLSFDIAALELYLPLLTGGVLVLADPLQGEIPHLAAKAEHEQVSILQGTPTLWNILAGQPWGTFAKNLKLLCGGEALEKTTAERLLEISKSVWNVYGPTETTVWSSTFELKREAENITLIGKPIANTQMYVLDELMQPTPIGVAGELYVGGLGLARGYINRPDLTAEKFVPDPFTGKQGMRLYRTGDIARWKPDGNLEFAGRKDHQVKLRGHRIELGEIEAALQEHLGVAQAVVGISAAADGEKQLVAYFTAQHGSEPIDVSSLRAGLYQKLPAYMVPGLCMELEQLPLTPNGKVDRRALPIPRPHRERHRAPRNPEEEKLCRIFAEVLSLEQIHIDDDFFALGGHSLMAMQVVSRVQAALGATLTVRMIFEAPTVAQLARFLISNQKVALNTADRYAKPSAVRV